MAAYPPGGQNEAWGQAPYPPGSPNPAWGQQRPPMVMQQQQQQQQQHHPMPPRQHVMQSFPPPNTGVWTTNFCSCCDDCSSCCCALFCPCVLVGRIAEIIDQGSSSCLSAGCLFYLLQACTGCGFLYTCGYRGRLRQKYGLPPTPCGDCCTDWCCLCCSLAQQVRELQNRGIDPSQGWEANRVAYLQPPQPPKMQY